MANYNIKQISPCRYIAQSYFGMLKWTLKVIYN